MFNKKMLSYLGYACLILFATLFIAIFLKSTNIGNFLYLIENKTFDLRQSVLANSGYKKTNKAIDIIAIDDASYEYLLAEYGEWPIPRHVYADVINYIEKQKPSAIAFDLMFVKSMKSSFEDDTSLINAIKNNNNVYVAMNFDDQPFDVRKPADLDKKLSVNVKNDSNIKFSNNLKFSNCRTILPQIMENTKNIGFINVSRSEDGILRQVNPFMIYKNNFYPYMSLMVGLKYLENTEHLKINDFYINKAGNLIIGKRQIPMTDDGGIILNWYGPTGAFNYIPFYKIVKAAQGKDKKTKYDFHNKVIYVGTTAVSLYDAKSTPLDKLYPGVEVHATLINNLIDNNFIKKVDEKVNVLISVFLGILIGIIVIRSSSIIIALTTTLLTAVGYIVLAYYLMKFGNLWVAIVLPVVVMSIAFAAAYIIKYVLKSRDFEYQYRLATTDGLTDLYNHRYFQEQMIMQVANSRRYNTKFSLILIDIDFFKNFNDRFGHQSGDAVLRQVSQKLKKNVRSSDFVCRYGGEEMSIILPNTDKSEAIITAQKICDAVAEAPLKLAGDKESIVTISLGVSTYPEDGQSPGEIIESADKRLYYAKEHGRNQVGQ